MLTPHCTLTHFCTAVFHNTNFCDTFIFCSHSSVCPFLCNEKLQKSISTDGKECKGIEIFELWQTEQDSDNAVTTLMMQTATYVMMMMVITINSDDDEWKSSSSPLSVMDQLIIRRLEALEVVMKWLLFTDYNGNYGAHWRHLSFQL